jgi:hypothetical protein
MRKYEITLSLFIEAVNSFEAVNEFEKMIIGKIITLEKYKIMEILDNQKVGETENDNENIEI